MSPYINDQAFLHNPACLTIWKSLTKVLQKYRRITIDEQKTGHNNTISVFYSLFTYC